MTILLIAVSYRSVEDVTALLGSLQANSCPDWELVVADNSSSSDREALQAALSTEPRATYHDSGGNLGYFGGARSAFEKHGVPLREWTVVLNTDLTLASDFVERLAATDDRGVGVVAPQIRNSLTGLDQNPYMRESPSRHEALRRRIMLGNRLLAQSTLAAKRTVSALRPHKAPVGFASGTPIYAAHGSVVVFSRNYFLAGGDLNHPLFLFGEEIYVAEACKRMSLGIIYKSDLRVQHRAHARTGRFRSWAMLGYMADAARFTYAATRPTSKHQ